ncbi:MAG: hypothetical protein ACOX37_01120 [Bacillota bacterium]
MPTIVSRCQNLLFHQPQPVSAAGAAKRKHGLEPDRKLNCWPV